MIDNYNPESPSQILETKILRSSMYFLLEFLHLEHVTANQSSFSISIILWLRHCSRQFLSGLVETVHHGVHGGDGLYHIVKGFISEIQWTSQYKSRRNIFLISHLDSDVKMTRTPVSWSRMPRNFLSRIIWDSFFSTSGLGSPILPAT